MKCDAETLRADLFAKLAHDDAANFAPGTFGCHEAMHMASVLMLMVDENLVESPAVIMNPEWFALAHKAHGALFDLYQAIGAAHI